MMALKLGGDSREKPDPTRRRQPAAAAVQRTKSLRLQPSLDWVTGDKHAPEQLEQWHQLMINRGRCAGNRRNVRIVLSNLETVQLLWLGNECSNGGVPRWPS